MTLIETIGWTGSGLLTLCALPQLAMCIKAKNADGVSLSFLLLWIGGVFLSAMYSMFLEAWPLVTSQAFNLVVALWILKIKFD